MFWAGREAHMPARKIEVVDVIGAGDALCAGYLSGRLDGLDPGAALARGVDLGGLGTLIASLASLISFRLYGAGEGAQTGRYFAVFTGVNVLFLAVMLFLAAIL